MLFLSKITILHIFYCFGDHTTKKKRYKFQPNDRTMGLNVPQVRYKWPNLHLPMWVLNFTALYISCIYSFLYKIKWYRLLTLIWQADRRWQTRKNYRTELTITHCSRSKFAMYFPNFRSRRDTMRIASLIANKGMSSRCSKVWKRFRAKRRNEISAAASGSFNQKGWSVLMIRKKYTSPDSFQIKKGKVIISFEANKNAE